MILYFLRHAEAESRAESDFARRLTPKGLDQSARAGKFLKRGGFAPDIILTSPVVRAVQTARIVAGQLGRDVVECPWLACGMDTETFFEEIVPHLEKLEVLVVGHEPCFSTAIGALLGIPGPSPINIRKASLTAIELHEAKFGSAQLQFLIPVRLM